MPAQLQAGDLDRRITIQRFTEVVSGEYNEPRQVWGDLITVWAKKTDASAGEAYRAQEVGAQISARFVVRYFSTTASITPKDRISYKGDLYNITRVKEIKDTRNAWLEIEAVARADK